jgi:sigma-B regulation protein RsbU (phosphoserine phosphatase)
MLEMTMKNRLPEIAWANKRFNAFAEQCGIPKAVSQNMNLVFDELLNNVISYAYRDEDEHDIGIRVELSGNRLTVTIEDDGVQFNPFGTETPQTDLPLEEREIGGLGIHLVRNFMDNVSYQRRSDKNVVTLVKHLDADSNPQ